MNALVSHLPPGISSTQLASVVQQLVRASWPRERDVSTKNLRVFDRPSSPSAKQVVPPADLPELNAKQIGPTADQPEPLRLEMKSCDLNGDGIVNVVDVAAAINQVIRGPCTTADLSKKGQCTLQDVQRVVNASLGQPCLVTR
jgi:hypothetical protein